VSGSLNGKVIWVTGAGKGLGRAIAVAALTEGATVVATSRSTDDLLSLQAGHPAGRVIVAPGSVADEADVDRIVSDLSNGETGTLHGLVNCAGISPSFVRSENLDVTTFQQVIATNTVGAFICARAAARIMLDQPGGGSIVNVSSVHAAVGYPRIAAYAASKGAIAALTTTLAVEWADRGVRVNTIAPGYFRTDMSRGLLDSTWRQDLIARIPMGRTGRPEELGRAATYLLSDDSSYVTGTTISIDGGWQAW
jgi:NAD(P)-dependent dehydrogenase (short-subunit alcohol dehydrogenase family)